MDKRLMNDILTTWHCLLDKNECLEQNGGCQHSCVNKEGSFKCFCKTGYKLHSNRKDCLGMWWCLFHTSCRWRHFLDDEYCKPSLFCDLPDINLIAATNYREQDVHYIDNTAQETFNNGFAVGNIRVNESLANLSKYFRTQIKIGLQYFLFWKSVQCHVYNIFSVLSSKLCTFLICVVNF